MTEAGPVNVLSQHKIQRMTPAGPRPLFSFWGRGVELSDVSHELEMGAGVKKQKSKKGFTLIEVLIVVVIIAVLASLAIPRMLAQIERAKMAQAFQTLGALCRAEQAYMATHGTTSYLQVDTVNEIRRVNFSRLGVQIPDNTHFEFFCDQFSPDNLCGAWRKPMGFPNSGIHITDNGTWGCSGVYSAGATASDPCRYTG